MHVCMSLCVCMHVVCMYIRACCRRVPALLNAPPHCRGMLRCCTLSFQIFNHRPELCHLCEGVCEFACASLRTRTRTIRMSVRPPQHAAFSLSGPSPRLPRSTARQPPSRARPPAPHVRGQARRATRHFPAAAFPALPPASVPRPRSPPALRAAASPRARPVSRPAPPPSVMVLHRLDGARSHARPLSRSFPPPAPGTRLALQAPCLPALSAQHACMRHGGCAYVRQACINIPAVPA